MSDDLSGNAITTPDKTEPRFGIIALLTAFAVVISALYLVGYWSTFDINILEYATLQHVLTLTVYPVLITAISPLLVIIFRIILYRKEVKEHANKKAFSSLVRP